MKEIKLTKGQVALVDDEDFEYLNQWKWRASWNKSTNSFRAVRMAGAFPRKTIYMHRLIMKTPAGIECDHVYHNTLDNRKSELRNVTHSQNIINQDARKNNKLKIKGVYTHHKKFRAVITKNGRQILLGTFNTPEEAREVYEKAAIEIYGVYKFLQK